MDLKLITRKNGKAFYRNVNMEQDGERLIFHFAYDEYLKDEIKAMDGARWDKDTKGWSVKDCPRNWFQLSYLMGQDPYKWYEQEIIDFTPRLNLFEQQRKMAGEGITYRQVIWAAEMGLGKTLSAFMVMEWALENLDFHNWWWVGPRPALAAFHIEVKKWGLRCYPDRILTYENLVKTLKEWKGGDAPHGVIFDEFSRCKTPQSQRSQAAYYLANEMRKQHGENDPFIIGMTGTPAPKTPLDWYWLAEIVKPGFLKEGNLKKFSERLSLITYKENPLTGGTYPELQGWRDSEDRCKICGCMKEGHNIEIMNKGIDLHDFVPGINEIAKLYRRMKGLVHVYFKKDWLKHLPDKQYRQIHCKVTRSMENACAAIRSTSPTAVQTLIRLRELSDGFQYESEPIGKADCTVCKRSGRVMVPIVPEPDPELGHITSNVHFGQTFEMQEVACSNCDGSGEIITYRRTVNAIPCPKDKVLLEILDDHAEDGRLVVYGGFTGTIDRLCQLAKNAAWEYIKVDGRGWSSTLGKSQPVELINIFQNKEDDRNIVFIGHPGSAGMGLTLTAANEIVYYSNDFNGENRMQSEDRIHRPGMDLNKGALITDIIHLPSDLLVLENLKEKKRLQDMTLGQFDEGIKLASERLKSEMTLGE